MRSECGRRETIFRWTQHFVHGDQCFVLLLKGCEKGFSNTNRLINWSNYDEGESENESVNDDVQTGWFSVNIIPSR